MPSTSSLSPAVRFAREEGPTSRVHETWPLAVIILGLVLSAVWCAGLLWGAYLVLDWTGVLPALLRLLDLTPVS